MNIKKKYVFWVVLCATLILLTWIFTSNQFKLGEVTGSKTPISDPVKEKTKSTVQLTADKTGEAIVFNSKLRDPKTLELRGGAFASLSIGKSTQRELLGSEDLALVEYGLTRIQFVCSAWNSTEILKAQKTAIANQVQNLPPVQARLYGRGTLGQRISAADMTHEKCLEITTGTLLTAQEIVDARSRLALLGFPMRDWLEAKYQLGRANVMTARETSGLAQEVLRRQFLGEISNVMHNANDFELASIDGSASVEVLKTLAADFLLMCRLGEDCSPGSVASNRLCAQMGFCGGHVEETVVTHFHKAGLDWSLLDNYLTRLQTAIAAGDTSIFRKPAAPATPIKPKPT